VTGFVPPASLVEPAQRYFDERFSWTDSLVRASTTSTSVRATMRCIRTSLEYSARAQTSQSIGTSWNGSAVSTLRSVRNTHGRRRGPRHVPARRPCRARDRLRTLSCDLAYPPLRLRGPRPPGLRLRARPHGVPGEAFSRPSTRWQMLKGVPMGTRHMIHLLYRARKAQPSVLQSPANAFYRHTEMRGMIAGPLAYWRSRRFRADAPRQHEVTQGQGRARRSSHHGGCTRCASRVLGPSRPQTCGIVPRWPKPYSSA